MARWVALTCLLLAAACADPAPPPQPAPDLDAWRALADSARQADSLRAVAAALHRRQNLYEGELDSLLSGTGPARLSASEMASLVGEIECGRYQELHGVHGPSANSAYDFNGDRLSDRYLSTASRVESHGVVYLQHADGHFDRAGTLDLGSFSVCPRGGGAAVIRSLSVQGVQWNVHAVTYFLSRDGVETLRREAFEVMGRESEDPVRARRLVALEAQVGRRPGCLRSCEFTGTCFDSASLSADDGFAFRVERPADSLQVTVSAFAAYGPVRWRLQDPAGRPRASGTLSPKTDRRTVRLGPVASGTWTVTLDTLSDRVRAYVGWWDDPGLER